VYNIAHRDMHDASVPAVHLTSCRRATATIWPRLMTRPIGGGSIISHQATQAYPLHTAGDYRHWGGERRNARPEMRARLEKRQDRVKSGRAIRPWSCRLSSPAIRSVVVQFAFFVTRRQLAKYTRDYSRRYITSLQRHRFIAASSRRCSFNIYHCQ